MTDRIIKAMKLCSDSREQFCRETNITPRTLHCIFKKEIPVFAEYLQSICKTYPQLNPVWLLLGKGKSLIERDTDFSNKFHIEIRINDFKIPLIINRSDEYMYREAGRLVVEKMQYFAHKYHIIDSQRLIRFTAFSYITQYSGNDTNEDVYRRTILNYSEKYPKLSTEQITIITAFTFSLKCLTKNYQQV